MPVEVTLSGAHEMRHVARLLREASRDMDRQLVQGIRRAAAPIGRQIKAGIPRYMPSGYAPTLAASTSTTVSVRRARLPGVRVRVRAKGKVDQRDVRSLNRGVLAHPVFGNRGTWVRQRVRAGFVDEPFRELRDKAVAEMAEVIGTVVNGIARG